MRTSPCVGCRLGHAANDTFGFGAGLYNNNETASLNRTFGTSYYVFYKNGVAYYRLKHYLDTTSRFTTFLKKIFVGILIF